MDFFFFSVNTPFLFTLKAQFIEINFMQPYTAVLRPQLCSGPPTTQYPYKPLDGPKPSRRPRPRRCPTLQSRARPCHAARLFPRARSYLRGGVHAVVAAADPVAGAIVAKVGTEAVPQVLRSDRALQDQGKVGEKDERLHAAAAQHRLRGPLAALVPGVRGRLHAPAVLNGRQAVGFLRLRPASLSLCFFFFPLQSGGAGSGPVGLFALGPALPGLERAIEGPFTPGSLSDLTCKPCKDTALHVSFPAPETPMMITRLSIYQ